MENLLKDLFGNEEGVLSESAQKTITEKFESVVEERVTLATEAMDKKHTLMLQQVVEQHNKILKNELEAQAEQIDEDHTAKLKDAFQKLDEDRTRKIERVVEHYEGLLNESVKNESNILVEAFDKFLDDWLEEKVPTKYIEEAAKKDYSQDLLRKISTIVGINESVDADVREGMKDANKLIKEQADIIDKLKKERFLAEKTANLPVLEKEAILEGFADKSFNFVERNFDFFLKQKQKDVEKTVVSEQTSTKTLNVDRKVVTESKGDKQPSGKVEAAPSVLTEWARLAGGSGIFNS